MTTPEARAKELIGRTKFRHYAHYYYTEDTTDVEIELQNIIADVIRAATEEAIALERAKIKAELQEIVNMQRGYYRYMVDELIAYLADLNTL